MQNWIGLPEILTEEHHSFVYKITNLITGKKYIGKKQIWQTIKRPPLKGQKKKRKITKESDYKDYYGSSEELKRDVITYGKENFQREILEICSCKWECAYLELEWQIKERVLFREDYYNGIINLRIGAVPAHLKAKYDLIIENETKSVKP